MTHHHDHDHDHDHHHDHHHHEDAAAQPEMTFAQKMEKLLDHWIQHNDDHAISYQGWADQARQRHLDAVADIIEEAAEMNRAMNEKFARAKALLAK